MILAKPSDCRTKVLVNCDHPAAEKLRDKIGPGWHEIAWTVHNAVKLSRAVGREVPTPAIYGDYGGFMEPRRYQRRTVDFMVRHKSGFVLNEMGTGKTAAALWAFEWMRQHGMAERLLVLTTRSTMEFTWLAEVKQATPGLVGGVAYGSAAKRKKVVEDENIDVVITNHDMIRLHDPEWVYKHFDMVVIDEATAFKTWAGRGMPKRYKHLLAVARRVNRMWLMTGTPTPSGPEDAWGLIKLVHPDWPITKSRWKPMVEQQVGPFKWTPKPDAADTVARHMTPSIRITTAEALSELPPRTFVTRAPELSKEQVKVLSELRTSMVADLDGDEVTAVNAAVLMLKLLQVSSGSVKTDTGEATDLDMSPRLDDLFKVIDESSGKVIVYATFVRSVQRIKDAINERYGAGYAEAITGSVPQGKRNEVFEAFQSGGELRVLVAHPKTVSHGLTLTAATTILWWGPPLQPELYEQGNARAWRVGQDKPVLIVNQATSPQERSLFETLEKRGEMQATILHLVKEALHL